MTIAEYRERTETCECQNDGGFCSGMWDCEDLLPLLDEIDRLEKELADARAKADGCPCLLTAPCSDNCTCANPVLSGGCLRCCKYGSAEQRLEAAKRLSENCADALAAEREACAKVAEDIADRESKTIMCNPRAAYEIAAAIRARGEKP